MNPVYPAPPSTLNWRFAVPPRRDRRAAGRRRRLVRRTSASPPDRRDDERLADSGVTVSVHASLPRQAPAAASEIPGGVGAPPGSGSGLRLDVLLDRGAGLRSRRADRLARHASMPVGAPPLTAPRVARRTAGQSPPRVLPSRTTPKMAGASSPRPPDASLSSIPSPEILGGAQRPHRPCRGPPAAAGGWVGRGDSRSLPTRVVLGQLQAARMAGMTLAAGVTVPLKVGGLTQVALSQLPSAGEVSGQRQKTSLPPSSSAKMFTRSSGGTYG